MRPSLSSLGQQRMFFIGDRDCGDVVPNRAIEQRICEALLIDEITREPTAQDRARD